MKIWIFSLLSLFISAMTKLDSLRTFSLKLCLMFKLIFNYASQLFLVLYFINRFFTNMGFITGFLSFLRIFVYLYYKFSYYLSSSRFILQCACRSKNRKSLRGQFSFLSVHIYLYKIFICFQIYQRFFHHI